MKIEEKLIKYNYSSRNGTKIEYIVIHDTANKDKGANADAHYNYFNGGNRGSSAHYFVDDNGALRVVKDSDKSWHCGDGYGKYNITNANSIGVEMCINSDGNFNSTYLNTIYLVRYLMHEYDIPISNVVRHYDASRKTCPQIFSKNSWDRWSKFKRDLVPKDYTQLLTELYKNNLKREPDSSGIKYWNNELNTGKTYGDVLKAMGDSAEFKQVYNL